MIEFVLCDRLLHWKNCARSINTFLNHKLVATALNMGQLSTVFYDVVK